MKNIEISASVLSCDFGKLAEALALCEACGVERIHVDVMDGHFVPNITIGPVIAAAIRKYTRLKIEAHLMVEHPWDYIEAFLSAGVDSIGLQVECYGERRPACRGYGQYPKEIEHLEAKELLRDIQRIRSAGKDACLVINPGTPVTILDPVLGEAGSVLVMSVNPGFSGQKFMPVALEKIQHIRSLFSGDIGVDGGINMDTAPGVIEAGANILITASAFFSSPDPRRFVAQLKTCRLH